MRRLVLVPFLLAGTAAGLGGQTADTPVAKADQMLQGEWVVEKAEKNEKAAAPLVGAKYKFAAGTMTLTPSDATKPAREATYRVLAPEEAGGHLRLAFVPKSGENQGKELEGIFRFKDGALELCHCGLPRELKGLVPTDFKTVRGTDIVLMTMKKP